MVNPPSPDRTLPGRINPVIPTGAVDRVVLELAERAAQRSYLHIGGVMLVKGTPPSLGELRRSVAARVHRAPVLGYRLSADQRRWEPDAGFRPEDHVSQRRLSSDADLLAEALAVIDEPLPPDRPLWRLVLLHSFTLADAGSTSDDENGGGRGESEATGQYAVCYCAHHAFQDGMAIAATLEALFGSRVLPPPDRTETRAAVRPWQWPAPSDLALPVRPTAHWTPAGHSLTGRRRLLSFDMDQAALRSIARTAGVSRNQVCLAILAATLREWTPADWVGPPDRRGRKGLRVAMPVDLRAEGGGGCLGNQLVVLSVDLPCHLTSPRQMLQYVVAQTRPQRLLRHRALYRVLAPRTPLALTRAMYLRFGDPRYVAMPVTTVRLRQMLINGTPVHRTFAIPPLTPRQPMMIALLQHQGEIICSVLADTAVPGLDLLDDLWQKALARLHEAVCVSPDGQ
ncbi:Wax ester synthase-like Acyl-CoA acyltransferase domain protein [Actinomadura rubteroloni]|uniref:Wax ester synthase-like Acyl-CoA acyltransferase domain protein n=1 Tax=Actinomadura rubteroloni TaxID=1926885 RepID=A0A2P4UE32_9ACTN|nr:WS/DGAT domain-containing protein [Actinomadura rubteroloni]POM23324.1 Wax ester synthase-like Acyl-CoA acyltransferase domain protein [Actinomadura rubteroloni]